MFNAKIYIIKKQDNTLLNNCNDFFYPIAPYNSWTLYNFEICNCH